MKTNMPCQIPCADDLPINTDAFIAGSECLGAIETGSEAWAYYADETSTYYELTRDEIASLGAAIIAERTGAYSHWCAETVLGEAALKCVSDRYDADGAVTYHGIEDFQRMCLAAFDARADLTHEDGTGWRDETGALVLELATEMSGQ